MKNEDTGRGKNPPWENQAERRSTSQVVFLTFVEESLAVNSENLRRVIVIFRILQHSFDMDFFQFFKGMERRIRTRPELFRKMLNFNHAVSRKQRRTLDHVFQLADIPTPTVRPQHPLRLP